MQQHVYSTQIKNGINSSDARNEMNITQITKNNSFTSFGQLQNNDRLIEEKRKKRRHIFMHIK